MRVPTNRLPRALRCSYLREDADHLRKVSNILSLRLAHRNPRACEVNGFSTLLIITDLDRLFTGEVNDLIRFIARHQSNGLRN